MKVYFDNFDSAPRQYDKLAKITVSPDTTSSMGRELFVLVANEILEPISGNTYCLGMVGTRKTPMLFPDNGKPDSRILVVGEVPKPCHRGVGYLLEELTTAEIIQLSAGGGAWGSGCCFIALICDGQKIVSNALTDWENRSGSLVKTKFDNMTEFELAYDKPNIEFI